MFFLVLSKHKLFIYVNKRVSTGHMGRKPLSMFFYNPFLFFLFYSAIKIYAKCTMYVLSFNIELIGLY